MRAGNELSARRSKAFNGTSPTLPSQQHHTNPGTGGCRSPCTMSMVPASHESADACVSDRTGRSTSATHVCGGGASMATRPRGRRVTPGARLPRHAATLMRGNCFSSMRGFKEADAKCMRN
eukprot:3372093-Pleurochrysis_carterae.AAC.2